MILTWHLAHNVSAAALDELLQYISHLFSAAEALITSPIAAGLSAFPATLFLAYKFLKIDAENFSRYVLCPKCHSLYDYGEMLKADKDGSISLRRCTYIKFPRHPQKNRRLQCGAPLVKPIQLSSGKKRLYALHCYVCKSLTASLQRILLRDGMHLKLESWRDRVVPEGRCI